MYALVTSLSQFEHHVVYIHGGPYTEELAKIGIPLYHLQGGLYTFDPLIIYRLYRLFADIQPDCVHSVLWAANWMARIVCSLLSLPLIRSLHNNCDQNGTMRNFLEKIGPNYGNLIAVSEQVKTTHERFFGKASITVIPNGIACAHDARNTLTRADLKIDENDFIVGSVGRFEVVKRFDVLLESIALLKENHSHIKLILIGVGSQEERLRYSAKKYGIEEKVIFVVDKSANDYYALFDCFVMSSLKEGVSIALLEAMKFRLPCVVASDDLHSVITNNKNGLIAFPGTSASIVHCIEQLISNENKRKQLGQSAYNTIAEHFTHDVMVEKYSRLFQTTMR